MTTRIPSEAAIAHEMEHTGLDRMQAIRRLQQRAVLLTRQRETHKAEVEAAIRLRGERMQRALRFITGYLQAKGYSPSFDEIGVAVGLFSKQSVSRLLDELEETGALRRLPCKQRAIEVIEHIEVPRAPDGEPLFLVPIWGA